MSGNLFYPRAKQRIQKRNFTRSVKTVKTPKQMERHLKGVANHRRIEILFLVARNEGINVEGIANSLRCNFKTIAEYTRRLALAGLVEKKYEGHLVKHKLTPYGHIFISFLTKFSNSQEFRNK